VSLANERPSCIGSIANSVGASMRPGRANTAWTVFRTEVEPEDARAGLRPFARMIRGWLRVGRHDTPALIRARLSERLAELELTKADEFALQASSEPFAAGSYRRAAVKVVDVFGNESTVVRDL